jgi:hypothetical protein
MHREAYRAFANNPYYMGMVARQNDDNEALLAGAYKVFSGNERLIHRAIPG